MINWLDRFIEFWTVKPQTFTGATLPTQNTLDKQVQFDEIVTAPSPVIYPILDTNKLPSWVQYNQGYINKCVAATKALMDSIKFYKRNNLKLEVQFSDNWIYRHRTPKVAGMVGTQAIDITRTVGDIREGIFPPCASDYDVDALDIENWMNDEAKIYQTSDTSILVPIKDMDKLVSIMQVTDKPIMVWFEFTYAEWQSVPFVSGNYPTIRHSVTFIPPKNKGEMTWGMYQGEKAIVVQDSWGLSSGIDGKRIIKESFYKARNIFVQYDMNFKFDIMDHQPTFDGISNISAQTCLQAGGFFPLNVAFSSNWGPVSQASAKKFQTKYGLLVTGLLDEATKLKLLQLYP